MLHRLSQRFQINTNFFLGNVLWFFLSGFFFSRLLYIIANWDESHLALFQGPIRFFFMSDYNFSLMGGVLGFMAVLFYQLRKFKLSSRKYIDAVVLAFLFAAVVGYIGAFFGGQVYGKPTDSFFGILYTNPDSHSPYSSPLLPLALLYSLVSFVLFVILYFVRLFVKIEGFVGYLGMMLFATILLIAETYNGGMDIFRTAIFLNLTQIGSLIIIVL